MLSADGSACRSAFANDFQPTNIDFDCFLPQSQASHISPSSMFPTSDVNGQRAFSENGKFDSENGYSENASLYSSVYQSARNFPISSELNFAFNQIGGSQYPQMNSYNMVMSQSKPVQYTSTDFESLALQQKVSLKKQSLDILQGVMPDPLEASQEKRYMTNTERIQVPSSDHVAEIVGKNGQRIKQLREQLKVWVKTPSRDEPPIFEVTGLPEKLAEAKSIILRMSEHFTKVQQERMQRTEPNRIEDRLYVEQDKVGLIVGANGQTIRWVQQLSDTHIATPRKQESIPGLPPPQTYFTICGASDKVKFAKQLICEYVTLRCQGLWLDPDLDPSAEASKLVRDFHQRRQVEDTQRKPSGPSNSASGPNAVGTSCAPPMRSALGSGADSKFAMPAPPRLTSATGAGTAGLATVSLGAGDYGSVRQMIKDMEDMWSRSSVSDTLLMTNNAASSNMMTAAASNAWYPNPMSTYGNGPVAAAAAVAMGDRRYSSADLINSTSTGAAGDATNITGADGDFAAGYPGQQQQPMPAMYQQQQQFIGIKKSHSEEQVSPQIVGPGWM